MRNVIVISGLANHPQQPPILDTDLCNKEWYIIGTEGVYSYRFLILAFIAKNEHFGVNWYRITVFNDKGSILSPNVLPSGVKEIVKDNYYNASAAICALRTNGYANDFKATDDLKEAIGYITTED